MTSVEIRLNIEIDQRFHISLFKKWYACSVQLSSYRSIQEADKQEKSVRVAGGNT